MLTLLAEWKKKSEQEKQEKQQKHFCVSTLIKVLYKYLASTSTELEDYVSKSLQISTSNLSWLNDLETVFHTLTCVLHGAMLLMLQLFYLHHYTFVCTTLLLYGVLWTEGR